MFIGRLYGSQLAQTWSIDRLLIASILLALGGFAVAWLVAEPFVILTGLFVVGLGIAVHWPIGVSRAVASSGGLTDRASALSSVAAGAASGIAPFILGAMSDTIGFHRAFLIVPLLLITALVLIIAKPVRSSEPITS
jgi:fucose permease